MTLNNMSMAYIRRTYGVPAKRGARIQFRGDPMKYRVGTVVGASRQYLRVRIEGEKRLWTLHPTWEVIYLDATA